MRTLSPARLLTLPMALVIALVPAGALQAQHGQPSAAAEPCHYATCALTIAPKWNGLALVRGEQLQMVANLNFFFPRDISRALTEDPGAPGDSAVAVARRAFRLRRVAATFTDVGLALGAAAVVGSVRAGRIRRGDGLLAIAGGAAMGISIPLQFAADGALSRAVWWHNARYAR